MNLFSGKQKKYGTRAQAMVEFAIALPILMALLVGIFEVGRMVFIYSAVNNASREAARYASAVGLDTDPDDGNDYQKYSYCKGIRAMAKRSAYFMNLSDANITISYDHGPSSGSPFDDCPAGATADTSIQVNSGVGLDRVIVTVSAEYNPMLKLIPISPRTITSSSARSILGVIDLNSGLSSSGPSGSGSSGTPTATVPPTSTSTVPADTPTATATSDTPTPTTSGPVITFTPLPSTTPTDTPTITLTPTLTNTPTITPTPTETPTPTSTPTAVPGCDSITSSSINIVSGTNYMSMQITNPHDSITVLNVQVVWNAASGGPASKPLVLKTASLGVFFWTGSDSSGNLTIMPSTTVTLPGNNTTSTIIFTFDKNYQNKNNLESITINLSTPGCEGYPIHRP